MDYRGERCGPRKTLNLLQKWRLASANTDVFFFVFSLVLAAFAEENPVREVSAPAQSTGQ